MTVLKASTPNGLTIFCDEIRTENNGKQIYIGIYKAEMLLGPSFPARLPSFSVIILYRERPGESSHPVRFAVFVPGAEEPAFEAHVDRAQLDSIPLPTDEDADDPVLELTLAANFRDFVLQEAGRIKVRAFRGDEEIRLGTLQVRLHPELQKEAAN